MQLNTWLLGPCRCANARAQVEIHDAVRSEQNKVSRCPPRGPTDRPARRPPLATTAAGIRNVDLPSPQPGCPPSSRACRTHDPNRRFHTNQRSPLLTHHFQVFTELRHGCYRYWYSRHSFGMTRKHLLGGVGSAQRYEDLPRIAGRCAESPAATPKPVNSHPPRPRHCCSPTPPRCLMAMDGPNGRCRRKRGRPV